MKQSRFTDEQIIGFLKQADAGMSVKELCRSGGFSQPTFYKWRSRFGGVQPDRQEVTVRGSRMNYQFREFSQLWRSDGSAWQEALDWTQEDPRTSALQRQLNEVDLWLQGQPHKLATAQEALAVQELVEAMLFGRK